MYYQSNLVKPSQAFSADESRHDQGWKQNVRLCKRARFKRWTCAESQANKETNILFLLICIKFGT